MKRIAAFVFLLSISLLAYDGLITPLLSGVSITGAGIGVTMPQYATNRWMQATLSGSSAVSASVEIDGSTDNSNWVPIATILVASSPVVSQTAATQLLSSAPYMRGNVTAISGTGATVTLTSGE